MIDQVFPKIFPGANAQSNLGVWELLKFVIWFPLVFLIRGVSGYFNTYFINYCGIRVLEQIRFQVFAKLQRLPIAFFIEIKREIYLVESFQILVRYMQQFYKLAMI